MFDNLHNKLFAMWKMFDDICQRNNITYFFDSGCAIGAVREHDFIPWDDDIDIAILRSEYERLKAVLCRELDPKYKLIEPKHYAPYFFDFIPRLIDTTVPLRKETDEDKAYKNYQNRLSIDFIILDNVPDSKLLQKAIVFRCKFLYAMARSKRYKLKEQKYTFAEKIFSKVCFSLGKHFSLDTLIDRYERNTLRYKNIKSNSLIRSNSVVYFIDCFNASYYEEVIYQPFHGGSAPLPKGYHAILSQMYGDYMTPSKNYKGFIKHVEYGTEHKPKQI